MKNKKILLFDIETTPNIGYTWGMYEQNVIEFLQQSYLLSFAYKWAGDKTVKAYGLHNFTNFKKDKTNDLELVKKLWQLFDEADIIIAHYGDGFDIKMSNAFFAKHGLPPPSPYKTIDTKKEAKKYFKFNSNKLDHLGEYLGLGRKITTGGFSLWKKCMAGDLQAWSKMIKYNKQDVVLLEEVYNKLKPWMKTHPDVSGVHADLEQCKHCGSFNTQRRGFSVSRSGKRQRIQCQDCSAWGFTGLLVKLNIEKKNEIINKI